MKKYFLFGLIFLLCCSIVFGATGDQGTWGTQQTTVTTSSSNGNKVSIVDEPFIEYEIDQFVFSVAKVPSSSEKLIKIKNIGDVNFIGDVSVVGDVKEFVSAEVCDVDGECSVSNVLIPTGSTFFVKLKGSFVNSPKKEEGFVRLHYELAENEDRVFELPIGVEKLGFNFLAIDSFESSGTPPTGFVVGVLIILGLIIFIWGGGL